MRAHSGSGSDGSGSDSSGGSDRRGRGRQRRSHSRSRHTYATLAPPSAVAPRHLAHPRPGGFLRALQWAFTGSGCLVWFLLTLLMVCILGLYFWERFAVPPAEAQPQPGLPVGLPQHFSPRSSVLSYNVYGLPKWLVGPLNRRQRMQQICDTILQQYGGADVLAFQEVFEGGTRRLLEQRLGAEYPYRTWTTAARWPRLNSGLLVMSRLPFVLHGGVAQRFEEFARNDWWASGNPLVISRKGVLTVLVDARARAPGMYFVLSNVHMQSEGDLGTRRAQMVQAREANARWRHAFAADLGANSTIAAVVLGDMNVDLPDADAPALAPYLVHAPPTGTFTFDTYGDEAMTLDYAYAAPSPAYVYTTRVYGTHGSDHFPIVFTADTI